MNYFTIQIYRDEEIIQNGMIDKIKSKLFNSNLILSITINSHNIKSLTRSLKWIEIPGSSSRIAHIFFFEILATHFHPTITKLPRVPSNIK